jgi:hypothetical protein
VSLTAEERLRQQYEEARREVRELEEWLEESRSRAKELERLWRLEQRHNMRGIGHAQET